MKLKLKPKPRSVRDLFSLIDDPLNRYYETEALKLEEFLSIKYGGPVKDFLPSVLMQPLGDLIRNPGKRVRGRLVEIGFEMAKPGRSKEEIDFELCGKMAQAIEYLHVGSLVVDDIQDGSKMRRGRPSHHLKWGMPISLNTGNWLYFWPLQVIQNLKISPETELKLYRFYHRTLIRAHVGQALDVGISMTRIPQEKVPGLCLSSIELKSGALFALALVSGAILGGADDKTIQLLDEFGHGFGMSLQMFDDLGNVKGITEPAKKWEDLLLRRPSWIWACAASHYSKTTYDQFVQAVLQLPQDRRLIRWFEQYRFIETSKKEVLIHLNGCYNRLEKGMPQIPASKNLLTKIKLLGQEIAKSYG